MRPGPPRGEAAELSVMVTADMTETPTPGGPQVYGMPAMLIHMAEVSHTILAPHLEPGEIGVGDAGDVDRRVLATVGTEVRLIATVAKVGPQQLVCEVLVRTGGLLAARGSYTFRVMQASDFTSMVSERRAP